MITVCEDPNRSTGRTQLLSVGFQTRHQAETWARKQKVKIQEKYPWAKGVFVQNLVEALGDKAEHKLSPDDPRYKENVAALIEEHTKEN